jgi:hypothetical protein
VWVFLYLLYIVWGIVQIFAFVEGAHVWLGFGTFGTVVALVLCFMFAAPGTLVLSIVGFYGAWKGWNWPAWQAAILTFPYVILSIAIFGFAGIASLISNFRSR